MGANGYVDLFIDGRLVESAGLKPAQIQLSRLMLGNAPAKSRDTFHGMLAAVQLSEATSTSRPQVEGCDEISAKGSPDPGLLGSWTFAIEDRLVDQSKHSRDGELKGGLNWSPPVAIG